MPPPLSRMTVSNHISTLDDPLTWGILPASSFFTSRTTRWTLGASDVMFTNPVFSEFFRRGQVIETFRGKGVFQKAIDVAIQKLDQGHWLHFYPEGKINQPSTYPRDEQGGAYLPRFKWGIGRTLASTSNMPSIIPMWITGFDRMMPEGRRWPFKYLPRLRTHLTITFGAPLPAEELAGLIAAIRHDEKICDKDTVLRTAITTHIHRRLQALGKSVSGASLAEP
ncbi:acyltransferase-domain-containing protein [Mycena floridula]|nr:acyltransferase-domain-containing protein [Mycena floridula]